MADSESAVRSPSGTISVRAFTCMDCGRAQVDDRWVAVERSPDAQEPVGLCPQCADRRIGERVRGLD